MSDEWPPGTTGWYLARWRRAVEVLFEPLSSWLLKLTDALARRLDALRRRIGR